MAYTSEEKTYQKLQTIASWVAALSVLFALLTILNERIQRVRKRDHGRTAAEEQTMGYFYVRPVPYFAALLGRETVVPRLPTITGLIEAGDAGLWTSAALDQLDPFHGDVCWVALYGNIFQQVVDEMQPAEDKRFKKVHTYLARAREWAAAEWTKNETLKKQWLDEEDRLARERAHLDSRQLQARRQRLAEDKVFPLRSMLYRSDREALSRREERLQSPGELLSQSGGGAPEERMDPGANESQMVEQSGSGTPEEPTDPGANESQMVAQSGSGTPEEPTDPGANESQMVAQSGSGTPEEPTDPGANESQMVAQPDNTHPRLINCARPLDPTSTPNNGVGGDRPIPVDQQRVSHAAAYSSDDSASSRIRAFGRTVSGLYRPGRSSSTHSLWDQQSDDPLGRADVGLNQVRTAWTLDRKPCIETSREELAALALVLGVHLKVNVFSNAVSGIGAFGTSLYAAQSGGYWKLHLVHGSRIPKHLKSQGSGYTTLMAKHLACGSIPFADSPLWVASVYCTDGVLCAIKHGKHIQDSRTYGGSSLEYLRRLPAAKQIDAFYGVQDGNETPDIPYGAILRANGQPVGEHFTWPRAVVGIAFGGLVPQAAPNVSAAVRFTVTGKLDPSGTTINAAISAVEELIDKLHKMDVDSQLFGPYVTMRVDANMSTDNVNYTTPSRGPPRDSAARFGRYMNLLERVVARAAVRNRENCVQEVYEAACKLVSGKYRLAVGDRGESACSDTSNNRLKVEVPKHPPVSSGSGSGSGQGDDDDLARCVEGVTSRLDAAEPIPLDDCATVVRCILALWADQVPATELEEFRQDGMCALRFDRSPATPTPTSTRPYHGSSPRLSATLNPHRGEQVATLEDLPAICALG